jgi:hypothetical protein
MMVERWLSPDPGAVIRVKRLVRGAYCGRCVYVEAQHCNELIAMHFFRHLDGRWCVFPPGEVRPEMRACLNGAKD